MLADFVRYAAANTAMGAVTVTVMVGHVYWQAVALAVPCILLCAYVTARGLPTQTPGKSVTSGNRGA